MSTRNRPSLPLPLLALLTLGLGGCFNPDYGVVGFACKQDKCPEGYSCEATQDGKRCIKNGIKLDGGVDRNNQPDLPRDLKGTDVKPDRAPDLAKPDMNRGPVVTLVSPTDTATMSLKAPIFTFGVLGSAPPFNCTMYLGSGTGPTWTMAGSKKANTSGKHIFTFAKGMPTDGTYSWKVSCVDKESKTGESTTIWTVTVGPILLKACKQTNWDADTRYKLDTSLTKIATDCFVIDKPRVELDGNGKNLEADRYKDLLYHRSSQAPLRLLMNTAGTINTTPVWTTPFTSDKAGDHYTAGDFNDDLRLDLVTQAETSTMRAFLGLSGGYLQTSKSTYFWHSPGNNHTAAQVLDFDQDGKADLLTATHSGLEAFYLNLGTALTGTPHTFNMGTNTRHLTLANMDSDTRVDALFGNIPGVDDAWYVARNLAPSSGAGAKFSVYFKSSDTKARGPGAGLVADLNGDHRWDLVLPRVFTDTKGTQRETHIYLQHSTTGDIGFHASMPNKLPMGAGDLDGDGDTDLLVYIPGQTSVHTSVVMMDNVTQNGAPTFTGKKTITPVNGVVSASLADMEGDGKPDLVIVKNQATSPVEIHQNSSSPGTYSFTTVNPTMGPGKVQQMAIRDMTGNGIMDIVVSQHDVSSPLNPNQFLELCTWTATSTMTCGTVLVTANESVPFSVYVLGDLDTTPIRGIKVEKAATGVDIKNFGIIRGFAVGVDVMGDDATVESLTVQDSDHYGVRFRSVKTGMAYKVKTRHHHQGAGVGIFDSGSAQAIQVTDCTLCPAGVEGRLTAVSTYCVNSKVDASGNTIFLNNGCLQTKMKTCR